MHDQPHEHLQADPPGAVPAKPPLKAVLAEETPVPHPAPGQVGRARQTLVALTLLAAAGTTTAACTSDAKTDTPPTSDRNTNAPANPVPHVLETPFAERNLDAYCEYGKRYLKPEVLPLPLSTSEETSKNWVHRTPGGNLIVEESYPANPEAGAKNPKSREAIDRVGTLFLNCGNTNDLIEVNTRIDGIVTDCVQHGANVNGKGERGFRLDVNDQKLSDANDGKSIVLKEEVMRGETDNNCNPLPNSGNASPPSRG
jgi:hypothetical protein